MKKIERIPRLVEACRNTQRIVLVICALLFMVTISATDAQVAAHRLREELALLSTVDLDFVAREIIQANAGPIERAIQRAAFKYDILIKPTPTARHLIPVHLNAIQWFVNPDPNDGDTLHRIESRLNHLTAIHYFIADSTDVYEKVDGIFSVIDSQKVVVRLISVGRPNERTPIADKEYSVHLVLQLMAKPGDIDLLAVNSVCNRAELVETTNSTFITVQVATTVRGTGFNAGRFKGHELLEGAGLRRLYYFGDDSQAELRCLLGHRQDLLGMRPDRAIQRLDDQAAGEDRNVSLLGVPISTDSKLVLHLGPSILLVGMLYMLVYMRALTTAVARIAVTSSTHRPWAPIMRGKLPVALAIFTMVLVPVVAGLAVTIHEWGGANTSRLYLLSVTTVIASVSVMTYRCSLRIQRKLGS